ncbi:MAG: O-methyltransferase [Thermaerobacter sp.]|nr:O-methyltransferase [Thermaerobacter sp.]
MDKREEYAARLFVQEDDSLRSVAEEIRQRNLPAISVAPLAGKVLHLLAVASHSQEILEIGALAGYSGLWLARALPPDGRLTSLELHPEHVAAARATLTRAGLAERAEYRVGPALDSLAELAREGRTFDFVFIDADKTSYPQYLLWSIRLSKPGTLIVADNTLWGGRVLDPAVNDDATRALRTFNESAAHDPRLTSVLLPMADGLTICRVG